MPSASNSADTRKPRGDSDLVTLLSEPEQEAFFALVERTTLKEAVKWLRLHHDITLSTTAIGKWAAKMRRKDDDFRFSQLLVEIKQDNEQATKLASQIGSASQLNDANVLMLSQALFQARRTGDPGEMKTAAKLFSTVMESVAKAKAADAAVITAETGRDRFQFDAAKSALAQAATLQHINEGGGNEREKVERAIETLFGRGPEHLTSSNFGGGEDVSYKSPAGTASNIVSTFNVRKDAE